MKGIVPSKQIDLEFSPKTSLLDVFRKVTLSGNTLEEEIDLHEHISDELRICDEVRLDIADTNIPNFLLRELSWLHYYGFHAQIRAKSSMIVENLKLHPFSPAISDDISSNILTIRSKDDYQQYWIGDEFVHAIDQSRLESNLRKSHKKSKLFLPYPYHAPLPSRECYEIIMVMDIKGYLSGNGKMVLSKGLQFALTPEGVYFKNPTLIYENKTYSLLERSNLVWAEIHSDTAMELFQKSDLTYGDSIYYLRDQQFVPSRKHEVMELDMNELSTMEDFILEKTRVDYQLQANQFCEFGKVRFHVTLTPPTILLSEGYHLADEYQIESHHRKELRNLAMGIGSIDLLLESSKVSVWKSSLLQLSSNESHSLIRSIAIFSDLLGGVVSLREYLLQQYLHQVSRFHQSNDSFKKIEERIAELHQELSIMHSTQGLVQVDAIRKLEDSLASLENIKSRYVQDTSNQEDLKARFDLAMQETYDSREHFSGSLARIMRSNSHATIEYDAEDSFLRDARKLLHFRSELDRVSESMKSLQIPTIGLLLEKDSKTALAIQSHENLQEAMQEAKHYNTSVYYLKEETK